MEKIWLKHYPEDVPVEINPDAYDSVANVFEESVRKFADRPAFSNFNTTLTFGEMDALSRDFAAYLQKEAGIQKGDRVALMMPNLLPYPTALFGVMRMGGIAVNVNPLYTPRELEHQLNDSGAKAIVIFADVTPPLAEVLDNTPIETVIVTQLGDLLSMPMPTKEADSRLTNTIEFISTLAKGKALELDPVTLTGEDVCLLQYTGGTTGVSKGATLTHRNLVSNLMQFSATLGRGIEEGREVVLTALPLYHIFALVVNCLSFMRFGGHNVLITNPRDVSGLVAELKKRQFTFISGVNTLYNGLLHTEGFADCDFSHLKFCVGGGAAVQRAVSKSWQKITGRLILEGYGLSETSPMLTVNPIDSSEFSGTIGIPIPSTDISLRDEEGNEVPLGEPGEVCAKGPQVMHGYWNREAATRDTMTEDGYFKTGDIATVDEEGYFRIVDRKKDMILVSGFNVFPNEIEDVLAHCEGVLEAACIGVADERSGEAVKAFVVLKPGATTTAEQVREYCQANLTGYKVPKHIEFIPELPKSNVGKILRRELRSD